MKTRMWLVVLALLLVDCADAAEDRAFRDLEVGQARIGELSVKVDDGLATVRHLGEGELHLWAGAPVFALQVENPTPRAFALELSNVMVDGSLSAAGVEVEPTIDSGTRKRYELHLPAGPTRLELTTPDAGERAPFRFALMSDVQTAIDEVGDVFAVINRQPALRFLLGAGDLTQSGTVEELVRFEQELRASRLPYYSTLGNHDAPPATPWHDHFGRGNFRFRFRGVQFTMLDSASATIDPMVYGWLDGWLAEARDEVHVVAMHIPILDPIGVRNGAFGSRHEAGLLLSKLSAAKVDLTLYGHIHSFYQFDNAGIPAFISGGGGALPEKLDRIDRHFMVFEIGADEGLVSSEVVRVD